jgi:hypothetical protein
MQILCIKNQVDRWYEILGTRLENVLHGETLKRFSIIWKFSLRIRLIKEALHYLDFLLLIETFKRKVVKGIKSGDETLGITIFTLILDCYSDPWFVWLHLYNFINHSVHVSLPVKVLYETFLFVKARALARFR